MIIDVHAHVFPQSFRDRRDELGTQIAEGSGN